MKTRKKLIEVSLPLDEISDYSRRDKLIRHGHPSTLHQWWARRPLATARAIIFAQMVDDPSEYVRELMANAKERSAAQRELMHEQQAASKIPPPPPRYICFTCKKGARAAF